MPSSGWTAVYLPIQLLNGYVLAASEFWQLGIKLLETSRCRFLCVCVHRSFQLLRGNAKEGTRRIVPWGYARLCQKPLDCRPERPSCLAGPGAVNEESSRGCSSSPAPGALGAPGSGCSDRRVVTSRHGFNLQFPRDMRCGASVIPSFLFSLLLLPLPSRPFSFISFSKTEQLG